MADVSLRPYQKEDFLFLVQKKKALLLHDPGVGKTAPVCVFAFYVWSQKHLKTIWSMPKHLMKKNRAEMLKFSDFKPEDVVIVRGFKKQKDALIAGNAKVYIVSFRGLVAEGEWEKYQAIGNIMIDEMHKAFSTPDSPSSIKLITICRTIPYFVGMTGTLIKGRLDSAYVAIHVVEPRLYGNTRDFMNQHGLYGFDGRLEGWRNHAKINTILSMISRRTTFNQAYGEQEILFFIEHVDQDPKQLAAYKEFELTASIELEEMLLTGANEGVNTLRLRQILHHPNELKVPLRKDEKGRILEYYTGSIFDDYTPKDEALQAIMEDATEPLLVLASLVPEQERILRLTQKLGLKYGLINGNTPDKLRDEYDKQFQNGELDGIIGSSKTMATGYNWPFLNHVIFTSVDYDADDFIQAFWRGIRGKRTQPLRVTVLQYRDAVTEQAQLAILDKKSRESVYVDASYFVLNLSRQNAEKEKNVFYSD